MVAQEFLDFLSKFQVTNYVGIEDFADKFNFHFTVIVLLVSSLVVTIKQYILKPISCYMATDIGGKNLLNYLENYCWIQGTIPISYKGSIPSSDKELDLLENDKILYYQWVPFALGLQCMIFYLPRLIWQVICFNHTGTDIQHLATSANQAVHSSEEARNKMIAYIAKCIAQMCYQHREYRKGPLSKFKYKIFRFCNFFVISKRMGTRITVYYLIIKVLYLINGILQLYLMQKFLGFSNGSGKGAFGLSIVNSIMSGKDWQESLIFPRVGYCFVRINHMGSVNTIIAQCVLPVNMLNERLYIFLWCWVLTGVLLTTVSIIIWIGRIVSSLRGPIFTKRFLLLKEIISNNGKNDKNLSVFEKSFLRQDGLFLLKMISINAGDIITADIVVNLWQNFLSSQFSSKSPDSVNHSESSHNFIPKGFFDKFMDFEAKISDKPRR